jgi:hypothetical protein
MVKNIRYPFSFFLLMLALLSSWEAQAQTAEEDEYFQSFPDLITTRLYFSRKFTALRLRDETEGTAYRYLPNTNLNLGIGATYNWATLNLSYGFGFLNPDLDRGQTRYLDLQAGAYPKTMLIDLFGQFYKGYYFESKENAAAPEEAYYIRPDLVITKIGASIQYVVNHERFSFRAAYLQNEWQKKSAGTPLLGFEMYGGRALGDSALVPTVLLGDPNRNFRTLRFFDFGPNIGYAYTLVFKRHFFLTGSATANLGLGYSMQEGAAYRKTQWGVIPNYFLRGFVGYNSERWSITASSVANTVRLVPNQNFNNSFQTGNYQFNFIYRFRPGQRLHRRLRPIDEVGDLIFTD